LHVKNARAAVADLKTTTEENWWERHERVLERSVSDVQADVQRLTKQKTMPERRRKGGRSVPPPDSQSGATRL
jgi:hypothetical protein